MKIEVFGPGCAKCAEAERNARAAAQDAGGNVEVAKISDLKEMMKRGIMSTPAIAIDGKIMCLGRAPGKEEILAWIKEIMG